MTSWASRYDGLATTMMPTNMAVAIRPAVEATPITTPNAAKTAAQDHVPEVKHASVPPITRMGSALQAVT